MISKAETQRAIRRAGRGRRGRSGRSGRHKSKFDDGVFVAVDGEGFHDGAEFSVAVGGEGRPREGRTQYYGLLMASDGTEAVAPAGTALGTKRCLDFLLAITQAEPRAIVVGYGTGYDCAHILMDLTREQMEELIKGIEGVDDSKYLDVTLEDPDGTRHDYRLAYRKGKCLNIWRFRHGAEKYEVRETKNGRPVRKLRPDAKVCLWDVLGFFQDKFIGAMDQWIPRHPDRVMIAEWKGKRGGFHHADLGDVRRYTAAELRCLVAMMERLRDGLRAADLKIKRWDGAGAIAAAMFEKHGVKEHMELTPPEVENAAIHAYAGGHIEMMKTGTYHGKVWHYDVNSAYPDQFRVLPSLGGGEWRKHKSGSPRGPFAIVRVDYHFFPGCPFYPLFHRSSSGNISFPEHGSGWYWFSEYEAALGFSQLFGAFTYRVLEWLELRPRSNARPFSWIEAYYERRKKIIAQSKRTGDPDGLEKVIKLGLNSCYGKTAQQIGARTVRGKIERPPYFQIEYAGFVTAGCRAKMMHAAMLNPAAIIAIATDGIFSTSPLDLDCPPDKQLGKWEMKQHDGITIAQPGVYWLHDAEKVTHFSRGFNKADTANLETMLVDGWKRQLQSILVPTAETMITLGQAMASPGLWPLRGQFARAHKSLRIDGESEKRMAVQVKDYRGGKLKVWRPWKELVGTSPQPVFGDEHDFILSAPAKLKFGIEGEDQEQMDSFFMTGLA